VVHKIKISIGIGFSFDTLVHYMIDKNDKYGFSTGTITDAVWLFGYILKVVFALMLHLS